MQSIEECVEDQKRIQPTADSLQSYDKYLARLATFSIERWFGRAGSVLTPRQASKHGWNSFDKDTLKVRISLTSLTISLYQSGSSQVLGLREQVLLDEESH